MGFADAFPADSFNCVAQILPLNNAPDTVGGAQNTQLGQPPAAWACYMETDPKTIRAIQAPSIVGIADALLFGSTDPSVANEQRIQIVNKNGNTLVRPLTFFCMAEANDMSGQEVLWAVAVKKIT